MQKDNDASNKEMTVFNFGGNDIRVLLDENKDPWWVAKDVCDVLGLMDSAQAVERLDEDEKLIRTLYVSGQNRDTWTISESGLYNLIFRSNKSEARHFRRWVTHDVLPAIRKTGGYSLHPAVVFARMANDGLNPGQRISLLKMAMTAAEKGIDLTADAARNYSFLYSAAVSSEATPRGAAADVEDRLNDLNEFLLGACIIDPDMETSTSDLYEEYVRHAEETGIQPISRPHFFRTIYQTMNVKKFYAKRGQDREYMLSGIGLVK